MQRFFTATLLATLTALYTLPAIASERQLEAEAIDKLLRGNTIQGLHFGAETRQYFATSGLTLWIKAGDATPSEGRYTIENNQYCSSWNGLWNTPKYACYDIVEDREQGLYYFIGENVRAPFILHTGFSLSF